LLGASGTSRISKRFRSRVSSFADAEFKQTPTLLITNADEKRPNKLNLQALQGISAIEEDPLPNTNADDSDNIRLQKQIQSATKIPRKHSIVKQGMDLEYNLSEDSKTDKAS